MEVGLVVLGGFLALVGGAIQRVYADRSAARGAAHLIFHELDENRAYVSTWWNGDVSPPNGFETQAWVAGAPALARTRRGRALLEPVRMAYVALTFLEINFTDLRPAPACGTRTAP